MTSLKTCFPIGFFTYWKIQITKCPVCLLVRGFCCSKYRNKVLFGTFFISLQIVCYIVCISAVWKWSYDWTCWNIGVVCWRQRRSRGLTLLNCEMLISISGCQTLQKCGSLTCWRLIDVGTPFLGGFKQNLLTTHYTQNVFLIFNLALLMKMGWRVALVDLQTLQSSQCPHCTTHASRSLHKAKLCSCWFISLLLPSRAVTIFVMSMWKVFVSSIIVSIELWVEKLSMWPTAWNQT